MLCNDIKKMSSHDGGWFCMKLTGDEDRDASISVMMQPKTTSACARGNTLIICKTASTVDGTRNQGKLFITYKGTSVSVFIDKGRRCCQQNMYRQVQEGGFPL